MAKIDFFVGGHYVFIHSIPEPEGCRGRVQKESYMAGHETRWYIRSMSLCLSSL